MLPRCAPDPFGGGGQGTSVTPSGESASRIAFMTVGVAATVPPSPTPLAPNGLVGLGTGLKSTRIAVAVAARKPTFARHCLMARRNRGKTAVDLRLYSWRSWLDPGAKSAIR